jgi:hypothetical protein
MHFCPVASCKRQQKGFPRKYNLFEHMKRSHPNFSQKGQDRTQGEEAEIRGTRDGISSGGGRMIEELERLCAIKAKVDGDIRALERTMSILGDSAP